MKHVKLFESFPDGSDAPRFFYGQDDLDTPDAITYPEQTPEVQTTPRSSAEIYFNKLPKGLRNELVRPVKDMLLNTEMREWEALEFILPKIERFMTKSGLQWKRFPYIGNFSPDKGIAGFVNNLEKGYIRALEDVYFS
jgi:hypothetical protein